MFGGLKKTTSRLAITAAASMFVGGLALTPAQAADLGGDCCADLEERVAELEATTARKGNRHVSVKISGQINYVMLYWDDDEQSDVYIGDNISSSTRFRFTGAAKFKPGWSAGFLLEIQAFSAQSNAFNQISDGANRENADGQLSMRKAAWYIKSDRLGEVWLGRYSPASDDIKLLNVAGTPHVDASLETAAGFFLRAPEGTGGCTGSGCLYDITLGTLAPGGDTRRGEVIRYNTPSLAGFVFSVSWGEDDIFDVALRYKKEWNSIRVVGGIGYHQDTDETENAANSLTCAGFDPQFPNSLNVGGGSLSSSRRATGSTNGFIQNTSINNPGVAAGGPFPLQAQDLQEGCRNFRYELERIAGSFSAMHTPSGIYAYFGGHQDEWDDFSAFNPTGTIQAVNARGLDPRGGKTEADDATHWYVQLGIKRRMGPFRNLGQTTLYGEYQEWEDWLVGTTGPGSSLAFGPNNTNTTPGLGGVNGSSYTAALNQQNAALVAAGAINCNAATAAAGAVANPNCAYVSPVAGSAAFPFSRSVITDSEVESWGFGMVQNIDKAAMELWVGYRYFDPEVRTNTVYNAGVECQGLVGSASVTTTTQTRQAGTCIAHPRQLATQVVEHEHAIEEFWHVNVGGRLRF